MKATVNGAPERSDRSISEASDSRQAAVLASPVSASTVAEWRSWTDNQLTQVATTAALTAADPTTTSITSGWVMLSATLSSTRAMPTWATVCSGEKKQAA